MTKRQDRDAIHVKRQFDTNIIVLCPKVIVSKQDVLDAMHQIRAVRAPVSARHSPSQWRKRPPLCVSPA
jgi:hypothetical protein